MVRCRVVNILCRIAKKLPECISILQTNVEGKIEERCASSSKREALAAAPLDSSSQQIHKEGLRLWSLCGRCLVCQSGRWEGGFAVIFIIASILLSTHSPFGLLPDDRCRPDCQKSVPSGADMECPDRHVFLGSNEPPENTFTEAHMRQSH